MPPVLVHIGYHKTGSSWLQNQLFGDPSTGYTWLGDRPDTHPVRRIVLERALELDTAEIRRDFEPYLVSARERDLFPVVSLERLSGHPFSGGYDSRQIADRLREVFPEGRILIVIREQRSIIGSTYKQYVKAGGSGSLRQFLESPASVSARVPWFDFRHFEYDHLIRHYHSLFGTENVLALPYERFFSDGRGFVEAIAAFAGRPIPEDVLARLPYTRRMSPSPSALTIAGLRRVNRFTPRAEVNPAPLVESRLTGRLAQRLKKSDGLALPGTQRLVARSEAGLKRAIADAVGDRYLESNRATAGLIGVDLAAFGWML